MNPTNSTTTETETENCTVYSRRIAAVLLADIERYANAFREAAKNRLHFVQFLSHSIRVRPLRIDDDEELVGAIILSGTP